MARAAGGDCTCFSFTHHLLQLFLWPIQRRACEFSCACGVRWACAVRRACCVRCVCGVVGPACDECAWDSRRIVYFPALRGFWVYRHAAPRQNADVKPELA